MLPTPPPRATTTRPIGPTKVPMLERNTAICEAEGCSFRTPVPCYNPQRAAQDHARQWPSHQVVVTVHSYYRIAPVSK